MRGTTPGSTPGAAVAIAWRSAPGYVMLLTTVSAAGAAAPVLVAWLTRGVLDRIAAGGPADDLGGDLVGLAIALAAAGVVVALLPQAEQYLNAEVTRAASRTGTERLHIAVDGFVGLPRFEDPVFIDRLRMAGEGIRAPADIMAAGLGAARGVLILVGFTGSLVVLSPAMTAVVLVAAVPTLFAEFSLARRRATMTFDLSPTERRELFYSELLTSVSAAKEVRLFGIGTFLRGRMLAERLAADRVRRATDRREFRTQGALALLGAAVAGAGLVWVIRSAGAGSPTVGDISLFILAVAGVQSALATTIGTLGQARQQLLVFDHYRAVLAATADLAVPAAARAAPPLRYGIELRDVWFRYSDDHTWALRGVSLAIPRGTALGIVGRNGAGKSTVVKLLCRFYDPTRGAIYWDGIDLRELDPVSLRERITAVFQDFVEYDLSAGENIGLGDLAGRHDLTRIRTAARRAGIDAELVALPAGYDTLLSRLFLTEAGRNDPSTGVVLSGGQWQRLALARALMRERSDLTILDEPSAGLDAEAEHRVHAELARHRAGRTSVLVSHRLGALRDADRLAVFDGGRLAEHGTHAELLAAGGTYATLFRLQSAGYVRDEPVASTALEGLS